MVRSRAETDEAIGRIRALPYGPGRCEAARAQLERVEAEGPVESRAYALIALVESYSFGGDPMGAWLPFTRLLRWWDDHPEMFDRFDAHMVHWFFTRTVRDLMEFPQVEASRVEEAIADMARRYTAAGKGMDAVRLIEFTWARMRGAPDAEDRYRAWVACPRDEFSRCQACEPGDRGAWLAATGRQAEAVRLISSAPPTDERCAVEPATMLSTAALALLDLGRPTEASTAYRRALAALPRAVGPMVPAKARLLVFAARTSPAEGAGHLSRWADLLADGSPTPAARLEWLRAVGTFCTARSQAGPGADGDTDVRLGPLAEHIRLETGQEGPAEGTIGIGALSAWCRAEATALAEAFDERNSTDLYAQAVAATWSAPPPMTRLPDRAGGTGRRPYPPGKPPVPRHSPRDLA